MKDEMTGISFPLHTYLHLLKTLKAA
jgi:hypothetical protein